jgi:hypothetical protein
MEALDKDRALFIVEDVEDPTVGNHVEKQPELLELERVRDLEGRPDAARFRLGSSTLDRKFGDVDSHGVSTMLRRKHDVFSGSAAHVEGPPHQLAGLRKAHELGLGSAYVPGGRSLVGTIPRMPLGHRISLAARRSGYAPPA